MTQGASMRAPSYFPCLCASLRRMPFVFSPRAGPFFQGNAIQPLHTLSSAADKLQHRDTKSGRYHVAPMALPQHPPQYLIVEPCSIESRAVCICPCKNVGHCSNSAVLQAVSRYACLSNCAQKVRPLTGSPVGVDIVRLDDCDEEDGVPASPAHQPTVGCAQNIIHTSQPRQAGIAG